MGYRAFIFEADGTMRHLPHRIFDRLGSGHTSLPEYARMQVRYALVFLEVEDRRPIKIRHLETGRFLFDKDGILQLDTVAAIMALETAEEMSQPESLGENIVSIKPLLSRKTLQRERRWNPTPREVTQICNAIWLNSHQPQGGR